MATTDQNLHEMSKKILQLSSDSPSPLFLCSFDVTTYFMAFPHILPCLFRKGTLLANDIFSMIASITLAISKYVVAYFIHAWALFLTGLCTGEFEFNELIYRKTNCLGQFTHSFPLIWKFCLSNGDSLGYSRMKRKNCTYSLRMQS